MKKTLLLILFVVFLQGCSTFGFAYKKSDWLALWYIRDYVSLDQSQQQLLSKELNVLQQWHCASELPIYAKELRQLNSNILNDNVSFSYISDTRDFIRSKFNTLSAEALAGVRNFLNSLSEKQKKQLTETILEKRNERQTRRSQDDVNERVAEQRQERQEDVVNWLGSMNEVQIVLLDDWLTQRETYSDARRAIRDIWQTEFIDVILSDNSTADYDARLMRILTWSNDLYPQALVKANQQRDMATNQLLLDLFQSSTDSQKQYLLNKLLEIQKQVEKLIC